jgi:hypothetical protein
LGLYSPADDDAVAEAKAARGHLRDGAVQRQQAVVAPPAGDGAQLPRAVERLEDHAGVVREAAV